MCFRAADEALEQIAQCSALTLLSHSIIFDFDNRKESSDDFLHLLLFNWLSFALMGVGSEVYLNVVNIRCVYARPASVAPGQMPSALATMKVLTFNA